MRENKYNFEIRFENIPVLSKTEKIIQNCTFIRTEVTSFKISVLFKRKKYSLGFCILSLQYAK